MDRRTDGRHANRKTALCTIVHRAVETQCFDSSDSKYNLYVVIQDVVLSPGGPRDAPYENL